MNCRLSTLIAATLISAGTLKADLIIDVQDAFISAGGSGFVDVLISSNAVGGENVDFANYEFHISNVGSPGSSLQFANPQDLTEDTLGTYLFAGDADVINQVLLNNSQFAANAGTLSFNGVNLTTDRLLARLEIEHVLGVGQLAAQAAGEQFRITLQNTGNTEFFSDGISPDPLIDASSFDALGLGGGLVTVQAAAVPEPSSVALCSVGAILLCWRRSRRKRTA